MFVGGVTDRFRAFVGRMLLLAAILAVPGVVGFSPAWGEEPVGGFSARDVARTSEAIRAYDTGDAERAAAAWSRIADPLGQTLVTWYAGSREESVLPFGELTAFIETHRDWPMQARLRRNVDAAVDEATPIFVLVSWYRRNTPTTADGRIAIIARLRQAGAADAAVDMIRHLWRGSYIGRSEQQAYLNAYREWLLPEDHVARVRHLLMHDHDSAVEDLLEQVQIDEANRKATESRLLMRSRGTRDEYDRIEEMLAGLPTDLLVEEGMHFDLMRWHRLAGREQAALRLLDAMPPGTANPTRWYAERNHHVRQAIGQGQYDLAYRLAAQHGQAGTGRQARAEWLAGYVALRFLQMPLIAQSHLEISARVADNARERARALYWLGRAASAAGDSDGARERYLEAKLYTATFYGQLARTHLQPSDLTAAGQAADTRDDEAFNGHYYVRGMRLMERLGRVRHARVLAIYALRHAARTEAQANLLFDLALSWYPENRQRSVEVALIRYAHDVGINITDRGFPAIELPEENLIEPALVHSLIRQESGFNVAARSWAGARGLMQLMPFTARREARDLGIQYSLAQLTRDADYNMRLGTAHLARLMDMYEGAYPLVLAAYNAGAHRVDRWLIQNGDPRRPDSRVEWVDWIELIPFDETRDYVKRVLAGHTLYRAQFGAETETQALTSYWTVEWPVERPDCGATLTEAAGEGQTVAISHGETASAASHCAAQEE